MLNHDYFLKKHMGLDIDIENDDRFRLLSSQVDQENVDYIYGHLLKYCFRCKHQDCPERLIFPEDLDSIECDNFEEI